MRVWRQGMQNGQPQGGWEMLGLTCNADALPNARPMLTMAMIQEAFHLTPWATARTEVEPVGNVTLVGLDTFYRVEWSAEGFEPGEVEPIDPGRMLGYRQKLRDSGKHVGGDLWTGGHSPEADGADVPLR